MWFIPVLFGIATLFTAHSAVRESVNIKFNDERAINAFLNHHSIQTVLADFSSNSKKLVSDATHLSEGLSRLTDDLSAEVKDFGQDRHRIVATVIRATERMVSETTRLTEGLSTLADDLSVEVKTFGQDRRRVVDTVIRATERMVSDTTRLTDALCLTLFCISAMVILLGVVWAHKLYVQSLQVQVNRIKGKYYFSTSRTLMTWIRNVDKNAEIHFYLVEAKPGRYYTSATEL